MDFFHETVFTGSKAWNMPRVPEPGSVRGEHGADAVQELPENHHAGIAGQGNFKMKWKISKEQNYSLKCKAFYKRFCELGTAARWEHIHATYHIKLQFRILQLQFLQ